jgi:copper(I)-binding protein
MHRPMNRRDALGASLLLFASMFVPKARACEFYTSTLRITHPWTRATALDATTAVLCMKIDEVTTSDRLIGVETPVASGAELVKDGASRTLNLAIAKGSETFLSEEGTHIRLLGLKLPMLVGRSYPLKLVFEKGGVVDTSLNVDYTGKTFSKPFSFSPS